MRKRRAETMRKRWAERQDTEGGNEGGKGRNDEEGGRNAKERRVEMTPSREYNDKKRIVGTMMNAMRQKRTSVTQTPT